MNGSAHSAQKKALEINLDGTRHGTFAEIGAGQEVARWFFHVGKASATVAKSISAYSMGVSDGLYGPTPRYVSRERLEAMLDGEYRQLVQQLDAKRGAETAFFVFADTVATHGSRRPPGGHGWLGVRFQDRPRSEPSEVIIHIELQDAFAVSQQEAVGLAGVNLIYGAFTRHDDPAELIRGLMEGLDRRRLEIDMIKFSGPAFAGVDNRLMSLQLVEQGLTDSAMFTSAGEVVQGSELLHGRRVAIERGSFRPVTNVTLAMLEAAKQGVRQAAGEAGEPVAVMEMTLKNLMSGAAIDHRDFLLRADMLGALGHTVMISNHTRFDCVTTYLRQCTHEAIGFAVGVPTLREIFDEQYYEDLMGGILEGVGRLFQGKAKVYAYPTVSAAGELEEAETLAVAPRLQHLYMHLLENGLIVPVKGAGTEQLHVSPGDVLKMIQTGDAGWKEYVPAGAAAVIEAKS
ncbi:MAG: TonB-dependent receptor, partial [Acidobacteriota bacterium]|nr:TonB-dependent receptor [Acidobacteriota bacterium]